jgi:outer membrane protein OmpA-like peptidoglycan-associated protein
MALRSPSASHEDEFMFRSIFLALAGIALFGTVIGTAMAQGQPTEGACSSVQAPGTNFPGPFLVNFDLGKSAIRADEQANIRKIAQAIKDNKITRVCLLGTADKLGNAAYNKKLSIDRAKSVANALMAQGIPGKSLIYSATGEAYGGTSFGSADSEKNDRRVIVKLAK